MQKFLAIFAFFNFASIICCACPAGSFNGVRPQDCFTYRNVPRYNLDAETDCESLGGFLASIHDSTTNKIIGAQLKKMDTFANSVWLGGYYRSEWTWNDQTPFDFQAFAPGQNGTDYSDQLLSVFNTSDNTWYTTDLYSEIQFPYLCTVPNISFTTPKPTHSPCPSGSFPGIGLTDCFMFQNASLNWYDSMSACNRTGGQLASIPDAFTNNLIRNQLATLTNNMVQTVRIGAEVVYYCDNTWHGNLGGAMTNHVMKLGRNFKREDTFTLDAVSTIDFEEKLTELFEEVECSEDQARLITEGAAYFDVEGSNGNWLRILCEYGDLIIIPAGRPHRMITTSKNFVKIRRFFKDESD